MNEFKSASLQQNVLLLLFDMMIDLRVSLSPSQDPLAFPIAFLRDATVSKRQFESMTNVIGPAGEASRGL